MRRTHDWTLAEMTLLRAEYPTRGPRHVAARLGMSVYSVKHRARLMGVRCTRRKWTSQSRAEFAALYSRDPDAACRRYEISRGSAWCYASRWNPGGTIRRTWTAEEEAILRRLWPRGTAAALRAALPERTHVACRCRANRLRLRRRETDAQREWRQWRFAASRQEARR